MKSTAENVQAGIDGEGYEFQTMYPEFIAEAEKEGQANAVRSFKNAMAAEKVHHGMYTAALAAVKAGKDLPAAKLFVCDVCGHTVEGAAPDKCPVCGAVKAKFAEIA